MLRHPSTDDSSSRRPLLRQLEQRVVTPKRRRRDFVSIFILHLTFNMYKDVLFKQKIEHATFNTIRSKTHQLYTREQTKIGLSPYDDKRYVLEDGIHTLAYGHHRIPASQTLL